MASTPSSTSNLQSIKTFLGSARTALADAAKTESRITLVPGNESADLDSLTCALLYAYFRSCSRDAVYIPLVNIPRTDLALRPEFTALLTHAGLANDDILVLEDVPRALTADTVHVVPVDHNALTGALAAQFGAGAVVGCVDHHEDEGTVPRDGEERFSEPRIIEKVGSCTSLVVRYVQSVWESQFHSVDTGSEEMEAALVKLGLGSVLIDTRNLRDEGKTRDVDRSAVEFLEGRIHRGKKGESFDRTAFFEEIDAAKESLDSLSLIDVLRKDYKEWTETGTKIGVSASVKPIPWLKSKASAEGKGRDGTQALVETMRTFAKDRKLAMYALMTSSADDGKFQRELVVWALEKKAIDATKRFQETASDELGLEEWSMDGGMDEENDSQWRRAWWQRKTEYSRKRVAPLLREAANGGD